MTYPELVRQLMDTDNVRIYDGATCTLEVAAATKCKPAKIKLAIGDTDARSILKGSFGSPKVRAFLVIADVEAIDTILNESEEQLHGVSANTP